MSLFLKLFAAFLQWSYHCFDRIVIHGYLTSLMHPNQIVYFFRNVCGHAKVTQELLRQRTEDYRKWVAGYARNHELPLLWAQKGVRKEEWVGPVQRRWQREGRFGVYYILQSLEQGRTFRIVQPKFRSLDPNYQIVRKSRSRYTHYYFYILDEVVGPMALRVGSFFPFTVTAYLNGHNYIQRELIKAGVKFGKEDNRFTGTEAPARLQAAADSLSPEILQERIDYWAFIVAPKFSARERQGMGGLSRVYAIEQIEYCRNFIFKRSWPIRSIFLRSCELGLYLLRADRIAQVFGRTVRGRFQGKLQNVMEKVEGGLQIFRTHYKNSFLKQYVKAATFLRLELVSNNVRDFKMKKRVENLPAIRERFLEITDRFAQEQAVHLNAHGQLDLIARLAKPVRQGKTKVAGIKLEQARILRLLEVMLQGASGNLRQWTTASLRAAVLEEAGLEPKQYTLNQIRYDLRKLRLHGIIERVGKSHSYRISAAGAKQAILLIQLRRRIYGPIAFGTLRHRPNPAHQPNSAFEKAYHKVDQAMDEVIQLLAA